MKTAVTLVFTWIQLVSGCNKSGAIPNNPFNTSTADTMKLNITVGERKFTAILNNNPTTAAFISALPMTITMNELNGNEKYFDLPNSLPTDGSNPGTIKSGDLMLYGTNTLVLFYQSFSTSYQYTRLGRIDDPSGLAATLGSGNVTVTFFLP